MLELRFVGLVDSIIFILSMRFLLSNLIGDQMVLLLFHGSCASIGNLIVLSHLRPGAAAVLVLLIALRKIVASHLLVQSLVHAALLLDDSQLLRSLGIGCLGDQGRSNQV